MSDDAFLKPVRAVAVVGSVAIDRNLFGGRTFIKAGGAATYAGLTYRRLGLPTRVVCNVAPAESAVLAPLLQEGVQVQNGRTLQTTRFVNRMTARGRSQAIPSVAAPIRYRQIAAALKHVDCIHLGPLHSADIDSEAFARLADSRTRVVLDVQGLVRQNEGGRIVSRVSDHLAAALRIADIAKADQEEIRGILEASGGGIESLMDRFAIAEWIVTTGPKGGCVHVRGGRRYLYEPSPAGPPIDPTGAGDVFLAAYTVARFHQRQTVAEACRHAARVSAEQVAGRYISPASLDLSHTAAVWIG